MVIDRNQSLYSIEEVHMELPSIHSYEVKNARTGQLIPVVNGVHLHSVYNPIKESEALLEKNRDSLEKKNEVLILGLGFAYHVNKISEFLRSVHGDHFKIVIIEPNLQVYNDVLTTGLLDRNNALVYSGFRANELYHDIDLVNFLLRKPTVIAHPASFNLYQDYFKSILTYEAPKSIGQSLENVTNAEIRNYLSQFDPNITLDEIINSIKKDSSGISEEIDFLSLAMNEICLASSQGSNV